MAQPTRYTPSYDFSAWQSVHPSDPLPGDQVDIQFAALKTTTDQICINLALIQRDDGALANLSVGIDQLKTEVDFGFNTLADWVTATAYVVRNGVYQGNKIYRCLVAHMSDTFATDLAAGKWVLVADFAQFIDAASASAAAALVSQNAAAVSAAAALVSQNAAAASVAALSATSTTSTLIATGAKTFVTQSGKLFVAGQFLQIASNANPANYMHGTVTSYSTTSLVMNITNIGGSGTLNDWNISISGTRGPTGATGAPGAGTGDMLGANNLSDLANANTARTNLSAAKSANNSDITSLSGLTTALSVAQGGTGQTTIAAVTAALNAMVGDSGSGGTKGMVPAPSAGDAAANKFLKASGVWAAVPTGIVRVVPQDFLNSGTYTPSAGMLYCKVRARAGGGGGGLSSGTRITSGGGGGEGEEVISILTAADIGASKVVTIGTGGTSQNNGGNTSLGSLVIANGGLAGQDGQSSSSAGGGGEGGTGGTGQRLLKGAPGSPGGNNNGSTPGSAGGSGGGNGGGVGRGGAVGGAGATNTGGGGAGGGGSPASLQGGSGGSGYIFITEYCSQ